MSNNILEFKEGLYSEDAILSAIEAFNDLAKVSYEKEKDTFKVQISPFEEGEDDLEKEFSNFVLFHMRRI